MLENQIKVRAERNRTLTVSEDEKAVYASKILLDEVQAQYNLPAILNRTINGDLFDLIDRLPRKFADLIIIDPPYNLDKDFHGVKFKTLKHSEYVDYLRKWIPAVVEMLKDNGTIYICCDWKSTSAIQQVMEENLSVLNRITWQREKGRGALSNWKNCLEDIWFGVKNPNSYYFNVEAVKLRRKVIAPYKIDGKPKDWEETSEGNFRITYPSNFWDDISIPYWSMPENTDHPTQKPEKLIAKLILSSCPSDGVVLDPFLGSGTTSVVAKKLGRKYVGIEINKEYCIWAEKRLEIANQNKSIQGYSDGVFWERNTLNLQQKEIKRRKRGSNIEVPTFLGQNE